MLCYERYGNYDTNPPPRFVEGYANLLSYIAGDELQLHVSTSGESFDVEIARVGSQRAVVGTRMQVRP